MKDDSIFGSVRDLDFLNENEIVLIDTYELLADLTEAMRLVQRCAAMFDNEAAKNGYTQGLLFDAAKSIKRIRAGVVQASDQPEEVKRWRQDHAKALAQFRARHRAEVK